MADWLSSNGYNPRSPAHGRYLLDKVVDDLCKVNSAIKQAAASGQIAHQTDYTVGNNGFDWNIDLVLGPPANDSPRAVSSTVPEGDIETVWMAVDAKSVMTDHAKNRKNRQRDIGMMSEVLYNYYDHPVTGALVLVNAASEFRSPTGSKGVVPHENINKAVAETVEAFDDCASPAAPITHPPDGIACIVVDHGNHDEYPPTKVVEGAPAPDVGDPTEYSRVVREYAEELEERFLSGL